MATSNPPSSPAEQSAPPYAVVVVRTEITRRVTAIEETVDPEDEDHLARAFHYSIPPDLRGRLQPGHLVWVPFGPRTLQGVVVALDERSPVEETRDVERLADPEPVLLPEQIDLARWISDYYLAPIHRAIETLLPPGVTQDVETVIDAAEGASTEGLSEGQAALVRLLRQEGPLTSRQLARLSPVKSWRAMLKTLADKGIVTRTSVARPPSVRPKLVQAVRLREGITPDEWPTGRATAQIKALEYFYAREDREWIGLHEAARDADVAPYALHTLVEKGLLEETRRQVWRDPLEEQTFVPAIPPRLTPEQEVAWHAIRTDMDGPERHTFLLQGVTGSGKTEIYLRAVRHALDRGKSAIVLVPEIALTPQTIRRFGARFPSTLAVMHSRLSLGERYDQWCQMREGRLRVVVGSRSAIFSPLENLGLIVLDEEHEWSYKNEQTPRYHAREVALRLAERTGATVVLGSATPSLESAYRAERGEFVRLAMPRRVMGHRRAVEQQAARVQVAQRQFQAVGGGTREALYAALPPVEVVDMRVELRQGNTGILSQALQEGIQRALALKQQVILFLNRRGTNTFVMCRDCGYVVKCPRCDVPYTYHASTKSLLCHHCNGEAQPPTRCPECGGDRIRYFGAGTERVETVVRERYPGARVVRWDLDTTGGKQSHEKILDRFIRGEADVMIGTQMIAKGLDLPKVTLVGVISADTVLNLPDFRSGERTFQLLTQVAGRAGRSVLGGRVVVQTYAPWHPAIQAASRHDYQAFYAQEIAYRREHWYPPLSRLARLTYVHANEDKVRQETGELHRLLKERIARLGLPETELIGPAPGYFGRLRGRYYWHILVRGADPAGLVRDIRLPVGWRVDVDPADLL
jgi:primosomal protein N' (replication factor Y)